MTPEDAAALEADRDDVPIRFQLVDELDDVEDDPTPCVVAEGVVFTKGRTVVNWRAKPSVEVYPSLESFQETEAWAERTAIRYVDEDVPAGAVDGGELER